MKNLKSLKLFLSILLLCVGLTSLGQDSTKMYSAPGFMFRNSLYKMELGERYKVQVDSLFSMNLFLKEANATFKETILAADKETSMLQRRLSIKNEIINAKDDQANIKEKEFKNKLFKSKITYGVGGLIIGTILTLLIAL